MSSGWHNAIHTLNHPDELTPAVSHPDDLRTQQYDIRMRYVGPWVIQMTEISAVSHPDDLSTLQYVIRLTYNITLCHPDQITLLIPKSSVWFCYRQYLIRSTYGHCRMSSGWLTILLYLIRMTKRHLNLSHPDELAPCRISSGWLKDTAVCHPDDLLYCLMSSGWDNYVDP